MSKYAKNINKNNVLENNDKNENNSTNPLNLQEKDWYSAILESAIHWLLSKLVIK